MKALRAEMGNGQLDFALAWGGHYARIQTAPRLTLRTVLKVRRAWRRSRAGLDVPALPFEQQQIALETLNELGRS